MKNRKPLAPTFLRIQTHQHRCNKLAETQLNSGHWLALLFVNAAQRSSLRPRNLHLENSASASSDSTPPVMEMFAKAAAFATDWLESIICPSFFASSSIEAAKTTRLIPHQIMALMHIGHGSPDV